MDVNPKVIESFAGQEGWAEDVCSGDSGEGYIYEHGLVSHCGVTELGGVPNSHHSSMITRSFRTRCPPRCW